MSNITATTATSARSNPTQIVRFAAIALVASIGMVVALSLPSLLGGSLTETVIVYGLHVNTILVGGLAMIAFAFASAITQKTDFLFISIGMLYFPVQLGFMLIGQEWFASANYFGFAYLALSGTVIAALALSELD